VQNSSNDNAFDLDNYFTDPGNNTLTYNYSGPVNINVTINPTTNVVSFSQSSNWTGIEYVVFNASNGNCSSDSNNITLVVYPSNATANVTQTITEYVYISGGKKKVYIYVNVTQNVTQNVSEPLCRELWRCTDWSECYSEDKYYFRNRTCEELNKCPAPLFGPPVKELCDADCPTCPVIEKPTPIPPEIEKPGKVCRPCVIIPFILTLMLIILLILIFTEKKQEKGKSKKMQNEVFK
jgi:hypothetical protein